jgi:hypothetical protein
MLDVARYWTQPATVGDGAGSAFPKPRSDGQLSGENLA